MRKYKNLTNRQKKLFFSLFFILLITVSAVFIFTATISKTRATEYTGSYPCTGYNYSPWTTTCQNGHYTRYVLNGIPSGCVGTAPGSVQSQTEIPCETAPLPCIGYSYTAWGTTCQNGFYTRSVSGRTPSGCLETAAGSLTPDIKKTCTAETTICSFTYSAWGECQSDGKQYRTVLTHYPTGCSGGTPIASQNCTYAYTQTAPVCSFTYSAWGDCQSTGTHTRTVTGTAPSGCTGGNPITYQSCTYTAQTTTTQSQTTTQSTSGSTTQNITQPTSASTSEQDTAITPAFIFSTLSNDASIKDTVTIGGIVPEARGVEFDLIPFGSNVFRYIGTAKNTSADHWEYSFDTKSFPNGYFYLVAKISNAYGSYVSSNKIRVKIENVDATGNPLPIETAPATTAREAETAIPTNFNGLTTPEWQRKYFGNESCLDKNECRGESDPDKDGLSNNDEFRYRTDPLKPDSDGDGFLDGDEAKNGFNPLQFSPGDRSDKVVFENPKETGEVKKEIYLVKSVEMANSSDGKKELRLSGKGLPNSFVTIYVYSELPVILTVKTDENGNWSYVLDKQIENGEHQVYVAVTDNTGKITAKSEPLFFVKTAEAVTVIPSAEASSLAKSAAPVEKRRTRDLLIVAGIIIMGFIAALTSIGFYIIHVNKKPKGLA